MKQIQLRIKKYFYGNHDTYDTDIQSWVEGRLFCGDGDERLGIEGQIEQNRNFLAFLADFLVQTRRLDPKELIGRLCEYGTEKNIEVIEENLDD